VISTMILLGVVLGRWWRLALVVSALAWPTLLVATDAMSFEPRLVCAPALAALNTAVGVLIHQGLLRAYRRGWHRRRRSEDAGRRAPACIRRTAPP
jgi:hypothetical protein